MKHNYFLAILFVLIACKNDTSQPIYNPAPQTDSNEVETVHIDTTFEYESRTGTSGNYTYNYDVFGSDENGNDVSGNIFIEGKYGTGTLLDTDGNEIEVEVEWIGYGKLKATDNKGNNYELDVSK